MLHARLIVSPHAHARLTRIDTGAATAVPGVVRVFTGKELQLHGADGGERSRAPLAIDEARFNGHPVVAVVAETEAIAEDAAQLVEVDYDVLPAVVDPIQAMRADSPVVKTRKDTDEEELAMHGAAVGGQQVTEPTPPNVASTQRLTRGDVAAGLRDADVVIERRYQTSMVHQGYLEPRAAVASVDPLGDVTVWTSVQALFFARAEVAAALGMPEHRVRVVAMPVGGGFGGKFVLLEPLAAALAVRLRRPVAVVMSRTEEFLATTPAPQAVLELKTGVRRDGTLTALDARVIFDGGASGGGPVGIACLLLAGYYRFQNFEVRGYDVLTHKPGVGAYRAPGAVQASFAIESQMDEMARAIGMDALEFRLKNAVAEGDPMPNGQRWPKIGLRQCLERLREERGRRRQRAAPRDGVRHGTGIAVGGWLGGIEPSSAVCRLNKDGSVSVIVGSVDLSGTNTAFAQIAAEAFGVPVGDVQVANPDTDSAPYAGSSGGSKITYTVGAAVKRAAEDARRQLFQIAGRELEAAVEDLELVDRAVRVRGMPDRAIPIRKLATLSMEFGAKYEPVFGRGSVATTARSPAFAVHLADVDVETETGRVRVSDHVVVQDVGRAINPAAINGQISGAVAQGIGWALLERMAYDAEGRLVSATLMDYALPGVEAVPAVTTTLVEVPSDHGPFGAKGVGEPPVVGAAAAIANAIADATGQRFTALPIAPEGIARALSPERR